MDGIKISTVDPVCGEYNFVYLCVCVTMEPEFSNKSLLCTFHFNCMVPHKESIISAVCLGRV